MLFSDVWLWNEFPFRDELGTVDLGINIVCKAADGEFWAVQYKFYFDTTLINKAAVDWEKLDAGTFGKKALNNFREPLPHQLDAINAAQNHFQNRNRGKLIMACGTGKTYTSLKIAEKLFPSGKILFLVPSIALLSQTLYEWATFAENPFNYICVYSDETVSKKTEDEITGVNLPLPGTTNPDEISRRFDSFADNMTVIFSTYQSLDKVSAAKIEFELIICDEAHRTTGYGKDVTTFTQVHDENFIHGKKRLYMTATPKLYKADAKKTPSKKICYSGAWTMKVFSAKNFFISDLTRR